jgi:hypothetical protein
VEGATRKFLPQSKELPCRELEAIAAGGWGSGQNLGRYLYLRMPSGRFLFALSARSVFTVAIAAATASGQTAGSQAPAQTQPTPAAAPSSPAAPAGPRAIALDDLVRFHDVAGPAVSPDGEWVAYTVSTIEPTADKRITDLWMVSWDGKEDLRLTWAGDVDEDSDDLTSSGAPRWSPDGRYLSFTAGRTGKAKGSQVWVLDRRG